MKIIWDKKTIAGFRKMLLLNAHIDFKSRDKLWLEQILQETNFILCQYYYIFRTLTHSNSLKNQSTFTQLYRHNLLKHVNISVE